MPVYAVVMQDMKEDAMITRYTNCPDVCKLAEYINETLQQNPSYEVKRVEITDNYVMLGDEVHFTQHEYNMQYFMETYEARLLMKYYIQRELAV